MKKIIFIIIVIIAILGLGAYFLFAKDNKKVEQESAQKKEQVTENKIPKDYKGEFQEITVKVDGTKYPAYFPDKTEVKKNIPVRLTFVTENEQSCALAVNIPEAGIKNKILSETGREVVEFTPKKEGDLKIFCGMNGMFSTIISVVA